MVSDSRVPLEAPASDTVILGQRARPGRIPLVAFAPIILFAPIGIALIFGFAVGRFRSGRVVAIAGTRLRLGSLFAVAVACGLAVDFTDIAEPGVVALVGLAAGLVFSLRNFHVTGMIVIAVGVATNLLPVALNGATPVRAQALVDAGLVDAADVDRVLLDGARELTTDNTLLPWLGDAVPVAVFDQVMSFGDLIILAGVFSVISNLMLKRRPRRVPPSAIPSLEAFGWREFPVGNGTMVEVVHDLRPLHDSPLDSTYQRELVLSGSNSNAKPVHD